MILTVTKENFASDVEHSTKPVVIDVFATWCGPCKHMEPTFEELATQYSDLYTFAKLNVDESRDLAIEFGVSSVPTFLFSRMALS